MLYLRQQKAAGGMRGDQNFGPAHRDYPWRRGRQAPYRRPSRVHDIAIWHERLGRSADEIATEYDLTLADVYAALAYYFDHREEIDQQIEQGQALAEESRLHNPSKVSQKLQEWTTAKLRI